MMGSRGQRLPVLLERRSLNDRSENETRQQNYGEKELKAQIKGLTDAGLTGGFIPWNVNNDLGKYKQYKKIWNKD